MKLQDEFKPYENMLDSLDGTTDTIKLLWKNPDGKEIDLNNPLIFQKELDNEKRRYQLYLRTRLLTDEEVYKNMPAYLRTGRTILSQKLKDRAKQKRTSFTAELEQTIYKHMEAYRGKLKKEKERLAAATGIIKADEKIWYDQKTAYDMSTEAGAIAYINRMAISYLGGPSTPERIKAKLIRLEQEVLPKLEDIGYLDIAAKLKVYINNQIAILNKDEIPAELRQGAKKPALIRQVRNKNYDISNKYAFGTYLSFSYRDMLNQNPNMSIDAARKAVCNSVLADLKQEPVNPTTTTAIKQLEDIIDSQIEFYNFIHAKRLSNKKSAEKRKQKQMQAEYYKLYC